MAAEVAVESSAASVSRTILVVEDEVLVRMPTAETLRDEGFTVVEAANAAEAMRVLSSPITIDLVMTDVRMPGAQDGLDLARFVRANMPDLKIIVVSSRFPETVTPDVADAFLSKPYASVVLVQKVHTLLQGASPHA